MKTVLSIIRNILLGIWAIIAIFTTVCLLSYNRYNITELGTRTLIIVDNEELEPEFLKNDLVITNKEGQRKYAVGDKIFFYYGNLKTQWYVNLGEITEVQEETTAENGYFIGDLKISYSDIIGKADTATVYHNAGLYLGILESRWGFMFLIILPTIFALVYEIYGIVNEVKKDTKKALKDAEKDDKE